MSKITWDIELLPTLVANSTCWSDVIKGLGLNPKAAGNWRTVQSHTKRLGLSFDHFVGKASGRGGIKRLPLTEILVNGSEFKTAHLRVRLIKEGVKEARCESCGLDSWMGVPVPLELDHINGINNDHRIENLRMLCPNCHALTDTWRGRNIGAKADVDEAAS